MRPSGEKATHSTGLLWSYRVPVHTALAASHSLTVASSLPLSRLLPSGLQAALRTQLAWPSRERWKRGTLMLLLLLLLLRRLCTFRVLSVPAVSRELPSGEKDTLHTAPA